jgi:thiol-disulfide isomerase/thioredoxin
MFPWRRWIPALAVLTITTALFAGCQRNGSTVPDLDDKAAAELRANASGRPRLIHFWATTCPPCVVEFPQLVGTAREFQTRGLEFVSISFDAPGDRAKAAAFLARHDSSSTGRHFLWTGGKPALLAEAVDPEWSGALPYSLLVSPGGQIVWRHSGPIEPGELREVLEARAVPTKTAR